MPFTDTEAIALERNIEQAITIAAQAVISAIGTRIRGVAIVAVGQDDQDNPDNFICYAHAQVNQSDKDSTIIGAMAMELNTQAAEALGRETAQSN
jgi:hypothetical protein